MLTYDIPSWASRFPELVIAQTHRHGGCSPHPWSSLNLGVNTADEPARIAANKARLAAALGIGENTFATTYQVHGTEIQHVRHPGHTEGCDALVTDQPNIFLGVTLADCTPILVYDPVRQLVAAVHAGWRGTVGGIVAKTLIHLRTHYACQPRHCWAYIGTCIGKDDFAVDEDVAQHFEPAHKRWNAENAKYFVDLKAANQQQLQDAGVPAEQVEVSPHSTLTQAHDYFSYRHDQGRTGRMLALVGFRDDSAKTTSS